MITETALADFTLPPELEAHDPPEARGLARDGVRLLVSRTSSGELSHHRFRRLPGLLLPGDLLVVNTSGTLPARSGSPPGSRCTSPARARTDRGWSSSARSQTRSPDQTGAASPVSPSACLAGRS